MNRFRLRSGWFFVVAGLFAGVASVGAAPPPPAPPNGTYTKLPDPPIDPAKEKALYTVGYAHLDTQWRWSYPQVVRDYVSDTLHSNFKLFEKYPNYVFNFSGSRRYEMMREYYPDDYTKLKEYVAAGRWFPCGSSVDEADANVPSLESFVRQVLYGNRYFEQEFGKSSSEFMLPDCFGFPASLPSVLAHCGIKGFSTQKLTWGSANGIPFKVGSWIGPDGRSVVAALDPGGYGGGISEDLSQNQGWLKRIDKTGAQSGAFVDYHYYGTGDKGGSPADDAVHWLEHSLLGKGPLRVVSATAERMFNDLKAEQIAKLPTYKGELLLTEHSAGSVASQAYMKRWNRKNELLADAAERASVGAMLLGGTPYPSRKLYEGWDLLLGSQMHDMLPGTSLPKAYEYCWNDEVLAANHFAAVETDAMQAIAGIVDTSNEHSGLSVVVYNPLAQDRDDLVEVTLPNMRLLRDEAPPTEENRCRQIFGPDGKAHLAQVLERTAAGSRMIFRAQVPSVGYAAYEVKFEDMAVPAGALKASPQGLENGRYRVAIAPNGDVSSIFDKEHNEELLAAPARLEFHYEKPQHYPAWNMDWADRQKPATGYVDGPARVRVVENGPVRVAVEIEREARGSKFVQTIRLADGAAGDRVDFFNTVDWQTPGVSLKAAFPLKHANPSASYDDKIGVVERGNNDPKKYEVPQHQWFDLTGVDGGYGVAVLNDSKFGSDKPDNQTMRLTLLYTPGVRGDYQDQGTQDFGRHEILYAIAGHKGDWREGGVPAQAAALNQPLVGFQAWSKYGRLGRKFSLLKLSNPQVDLVAVKKAEASDEVVVRLLEQTGREAGEVELASPLPILSAREINGQEKPVGEATVRDGKLVTRLGPFAVRAFALKFKIDPERAQPQLNPETVVQSQTINLPYDLDAVSSQRNRGDGGFDRDGRTYPAEQFPSTLQSEGVDFQMGPTGDGQRNALVCRGQTITLPPKRDSDLRVFLLAAARDGDARGTFKVGQRAHEQTVQDWSAFIGQWDLRQWKDEQPELAFAWNNDYVGLAPGFTKRDTVAWYASHRHHPAKGNDFYQYCYLFKYGFEVPHDANQITLPDNPNIVVFAMTMAHDSHPQTVLASPLYDTLERKPGADAPRLSPAGGQPVKDSVLVTIQHPLYWQEGGLRYTTDGSEPTESSPVYKQPFWLHAAATVRARMVWPGGRPGEEGTARYDIVDSTAPGVASASSVQGAGQMTVRFSEPLERASAENAANYRTGAGAVTAARLDADGSTVTLTLTAPPAGTSGGPAGENGAVALVVNGIKDLSPGSNAMANVNAKAEVMAPLVTVDSFVGTGTESKTINLPEALKEAKAPWTINFFVKTDKQPENRTLIAGFGAAKDDEGHGRYLSKFANGIHFWCANQDVETRSKLALNQWQMLSATFDGRMLSVYQDGRRIGQGTIMPHDDEAVVELAPVDPWDQQRRFVGEIRAFTVWNAALDEAALGSLREKQP